MSSTYFEQQQQQQQYHSHDAGSSSSSSSSGSGSSGDSNSSNSNSSDDSWGDEGAQLFSFFAYSMIVYPMLGYILSRKKYSAPVRIAAAIAFLAFVFYLQLVRCICNHG
jgi:hypothetical protein